MKLAFKIIITLSVLGHSLKAQVGVGGWELHVPFSESIAVAASENKVYSAAKSGIFSVNLNDNSIDVISKVNGLSDVGITAMSFEVESGTMLIGYQNGNIDLIRNNVITNLPDLKRSFIQADKRINKATIHDGFVYLATSFGVLKVNTQRAEISETFTIGNQGTFLKVNDIAFLNDTIFAATDEGVKAGDLSQNLNDFQNWVDVAPETDKAYNSIVNFNNQLIVNRHNEGEFNNDQLYIYQGGTWEELDDLLPQEYDGFTLNGMSVSSNELALAFEYNFWILDENFNYSLNGFTYGEGFLSPQPQQIVKANGTYWVADQRLGLVNYRGEFNSVVIAPNGPPTSNVFGMESVGNSMWFSGGAVTANWSRRVRRNGVYSLTNGNWTNYNNNGLDSIFDIINITVNPNNPSEKYLSTWGAGLVRLENGQITDVFRANNSAIKSIDLFPFHAATDCVFDDRGVLWVCNSGLPTQRIEKPLLAYNGEDWYSFKLSTFVDNGQHVTGIDIDQFGYKWITSFRNGIIVYDDNNTLSNDEDDRVVFLGTNEGRGNLPSAEVRDLAIDRDNVVWAATAEGVVIFRNPQNVFEPGGIDAEKIIIEDGENFSYLLDGIFINKIIVDGANRKWVGTFGSGLYLISPDGRSILQHFTTQNSPLISDNIINVAIHNYTGEVFIATEEGLLSYKGNAIEGSKYTGPLYAYPNPVPPNFDGEIGIKGLPDNAEVKITDITGNLVYETFANGAMASWDGRDLSGKKVQTGVYLVMASSSDGSDTNITKILFINGK